MNEEKTCGQTDCSKTDCEGCKEKARAQFRAQMNPFSDIKKVVAVMSGKGGVGKSTVTSSLAVELARKGHKVGILDADITGPSIPKMFGLTGPAEVTGSAEDAEQGILPCLAGNGVKVMSLNLLMEDEEAPVIWRGPVIANIVKQFWTDVLWGELDYLLVDMPPGTGDVPLTVFQSLPVDGAILVSSPQSLVKMIVKKAYNMADKMEIPIVGIVENYSYFTCPDCGKEIAVFGESKIEEAAEEMHVPVLGKLPINPETAKAADEGRISEISCQQLADVVGRLEQL